MILPPNSDVSYLSGMPFGHARNTAVENMLKHGYEWLFFLDDDVCIPPDTIPRLLAHQKDIISGVYYRRAPPLVPCMLVYQGDGKTADWVQGWNPPNSVIEVDLVGAGCLLIHRRVFERMKRPWFVWELEPDITKWVREGMGVPADATPHSEDFSFCRNAKRLHGFKIMVDTSIQCEHVGFGSSSSGGYQPAAL